MKLVRFGPRGREKPGLIDDEGNLRSLEKRVPDITSKVLSDKGLERLARINPARLPKVTGRPRIGVPVADIGKIVCIGLNYIDHAKEVGAAIPEEPIVFMKPTSALNGPNDIVEMPKGSKKSDWEIELGVVIGTAANNVPKSRALQHVAGYTVVNDVSEREWQIERGMTWDKGKGCDTFCPVGPWMVTRDEIRNPQRLNLWMDVNGKRMQDGNTSTMIFDVRTLVSYISKFMTLYPGDLIATGTPPGVGSGMKPPLFLKQDDVMEPGIEGLGAQRQKVRKWAAR
ncbi:MAG: fumarylacetoacetate hydrolase family protein [Rhodospirillales bacterium]|jgi:2-keto-4-pentenoate hydratase/2-oxohepta-3-ene-1,7-dioic acid hydratase in catechol pathway|nr:fumarylacetoacetate hydrolase family protein [Rhodospirillales bacterium]MCY4003491.1 fumarylacetoacetate hydrolase family protein [Rhodospirillales bacterium]MXX22006.1 fumarylacetoacetate hydrolase family protein [Rhodospirillales bacterium]MYE19342.1 fumarylacetoacetate hydrolase family protein [Rhodospirillales bacterium]